MELEEFAFQLKKTGVKTVPFVVKVPSTANIMKAKQLIQEELNKFKHPQYGEVVLHLLNDSGLALYPFDNAHEEFHGRGKTEDKVIYFADSDKTLAGKLLLNTHPNSVQLVMIFFSPLYLVSYWIIIYNLIWTNKY